MGVFFVVGTFYFYPSISGGDFTIGSWLYEAGSWCFAISALQSLIPTIKDGKIIPILNSSLYLFAAGGILAGTLWFMPNVQAKHPMDGLGQKLYTFATITLICALLWDMSRLLLVGAKPLLAQVLAMLAALGGAMCFLIGAILMYPVYIVTETGYDVVQINKGVSFFMAASWFFVLHSICKTTAIYQYSNMQPASEKEVQEKELIENTPEQAVAEETA